MLAATKSSSGYPAVWTNVGAIHGPTLSRPTKRQYHGPTVTDDASIAEPNVAPDVVSVTAKLHDHFFAKPTDRAFLPSGTLVRVVPNPRLPHGSHHEPLHVLVPGPYPGEPASPFADDMYRRRLPVNFLTALVGPATFTKGKHIAVAVAVQNVGDVSVLSLSQGAPFTARPPPECTGDTVYIGVDASGRPHLSAQRSRRETRVLRVSSFGDRGLGVAKCDFGAVLYHAPSARLAAYKLGANSHLLPPNWEIGHDNLGRITYHNVVTHASTYIFPGTAPAGGNTITIGVDDHPIIKSVSVQSLPAAGNAITSRVVDKRSNVALDADPLGAPHEAIRRVPQGRFNRVISELEAWFDIADTTSGDSFVLDALFRACDEDAFYDAGGNLNFLMDNLNDCTNAEALAAIDAAFDTFPSLTVSSSRLPHVAGAVALVNAQFKVLMKQLVTNQYGATRASDADFVQALEILGMVRVATLAPSILLCGMYELFGSMWSAGDTATAFKNDVFVPVTLPDGTTVYTVDTIFNPFADTVADANAQKTQFMRMVNDAKQTVAALKQVQAHECLVHAIHKAGNGIASMAKKQEQVFTHMDTIARSAPPRFDDWFHFSMSLTQFTYGATVLDAFVAYMYPVLTKTATGATIPRSLDAYWQDTNQFVVTCKDSRLIDANDWGLEAAKDLKIMYRTINAIVCHVIRNREPSANARDWFSDAPGQYWTLSAAGNKEHYKGASYFQFFSKGTAAFKQQPCPHKFESVRP